MDTPNSATRERLSKLKEYQSRLKEYQSKQSDYQAKLTEIRGVPRHLPDFRLRAEELQKIRADLDALGDVLCASKKDYEHITEAMRGKYFPMVEPLFPLAIAARELRRTIQEALQPYSEGLKALQEVAGEWGKQVRAAQEGFARLAQPLVSFKELLQNIPPEKLGILAKGLSTAFSDFQKQLDGREKRAFRLLAKRGWIGLEEYLTSEALFHLLRYDKSGGGKAIDRFVRKMFRRERHKLITRMVRTWWAVPYLRQRRKIVRAAIKAHKEGRYALSIPALLPLVDGLAVRIVGRTPGKKKAIYATEAVEKYHSIEREAWSECALLAVTSLMYGDCDFSKKPRSTMNRHAIMHGEAIGYPTEANSLRVILLIDFFARLLQQKPSQP